MVELDKLMFRREHFPLLTSKCKSTTGREFWDINHVDIPPYHPSMAEGGIDYQGVPDLLGMAIEATAMDLEQISKDTERGIGYIEDLLKELVRKDGKIPFLPHIFPRKDFDIKICDIPIVGRVYVKKNEISPDGADHGIWILQGTEGRYLVPAERFTKEIMNEYGLEDMGPGVRGRRRFSSPYGWYRHNLVQLNAIFYRNLVVALDNAAVIKKYTPASNPDSSYL